MKKYVALFIMLTIILIPLSAQKAKDVLYLKNGSIVYGKLIEVTDDQYKIKTSDGSLFIYKSSEVEKFINETPFYDGRKKSGLGFELEAGFLVGAQNNDYTAPFSFNILGNFTYKTKNIFGIGSGVEYLGQPFMPLFLEYKYLFTEKKTTPFLFMRGGGLFHLNGDEQVTDLTYPQYDYEKSYEGGGSFTVGTGISWAKDDNETYISFAYRNAHTSYTQKDYNNHYATYKNAFNRLEIKFGFRF